MLIKETLKNSQTNKRWVIVITRLDFHWGKNVESSVFRPSKSHCNISLTGNDQ